MPGSSQGPGHAGHQHPAEPLPPRLIAALEVQLAWWGRQVCAQTSVAAGGAPAAPPAAREYVQILKSRQQSWRW